MEQDFNEIFNCLKSIFLCFLLSVAYLGSLHVWNSPYSRNHPSTIKKRFISASVMILISPFFLYIGLNKSTLDKISFYELLGLRTQGIYQGTFLPLFLTMILFLGPITMEICNNVAKQQSGKGEGVFWYSNFTNLIWLRNHVMAPLSEEFTYRSCMMPLLLQCFSPTVAILINPLFFGVAHFHHMWERIHHMGMNFDLALKISCFQFTYTTIFGMYSAYIFYTTGHFVSIFIVHAFCNHMGFPEILEIKTYDRTKRIIVITLFIVGFVAWYFLLKPLTQPKWYDHIPVDTRLQMNEMIGH